jgi:hypothetical protein
LDGISSLAAHPQYGQVIIEIKVMDPDTPITNSTLGFARHWQARRREAALGHRRESNEAAN